MKSTFYILLFLSTVASSCCEKTPKIKQDYSIVTTLNNKSITSNELDSISDKQIYDYKLSILESYIDDILLKQEAVKQGLRIDSLLTKVKVENNDYQETLREYLDSLRFANNVQITFKPNDFRKINTNEFYSDYLSGSGKIVVFIISSFRCGACSHNYKKIENIISKYSDLVEFRYLNFSEYYGLFDKAIVAAAKQDKAFTYYKYINEMKTNLSDSSLIFEFLAYSGIDPNSFFEDLDNNSEFIEVLKTKNKIISTQIYSTPSFIVNNKVLDGKYAINYLEKIINQELTEEINE